MQAGRLRHRIVFETFTGTEDGFGNTTALWVADLTEWGDLRDTPGKERVAAGRVEASATGTLRVRQSPLTLAITEAHRVRDHRGRLWNIRGIADPSSRGEMLEMLLERGVAT